MAAKETGSQAEKGINSIPEPPPDLEGKEFLCLILSVSHSHEYVSHCW